MWQWSLFKLILGLTVLLDTEESHLFPITSLSLCTWSSRIPDAMHFMNRQYRHTARLSAKLIMNIGKGQKKSKERTGDEKKTNVCQFHILIQIYSDSRSFVEWFFWRILCIRYRQWLHSVFRWLRHCRYDKSSCPCLNSIDLFIKQLRSLSSSYQCLSQFWFQQTDVEAFDLCINQ